MSQLHLLRYGRSDDDNDMEVSTRFFDRELNQNFSIFDCMPLSRGLKKMKQSMSESNILASLRYGRSDDDNDMEVSKQFLTAS